MTDTSMERWTEKELDRAYREWRMGNVYKYDGAFYSVQTDEYICPCE